MRKVHLILTIGGGFVGVVVTLQAFFAAKESNPIFYAILLTFIALYGYGVFAGLRLADHPEDTLHLTIFNWLQVPWISSPIIAYRFASGFHLTVGMMDLKLSGLFRVGSDWQFSMFQSAPWGVGVNVFALAMAILLTSKLPPPPATPPAGEKPGPAPGAATLVQPTTTPGGPHNLVGANPRFTRQSNAWPAGGADILAPSAPAGTPVPLRHRCSGTHSAR